MKKRQLLCQKPREGPVIVLQDYPNNGVMGYHFNSAWQVAGSQCPAGVWKRHTGVDYTAALGAAVYAAEGGVVKHVCFDEGWGHNIVIEHTLPSNSKYTTVYWHADPLIALNDTVTRGQMIATIAEIDGGEHLHFGARMGAYSNTVSGVGALPVEACDNYPAFPNGFIDPENTIRVVFE